MTPGPQMSNAELLALVFQAIQRGATTELQLYEEEFRRRVSEMQIEDIPTAPRSPFQDPYAERVIGSIRRECVDHLIIN
jgi:hypothetical protein